MSTNHYSCRYPDLAPLGLLWFLSLLFCPDSINSHSQYSPKSHWLLLRYEPRRYLHLSTLMATTFVQGSPFSSSICGCTITRIFWLVLYLWFFCLYHLSVTSLQSHPNGLSGLIGTWGATYTQLVFMALDNLVPNCLSNPISHFCHVLPSPTPSTSMPLHTPFPTPNAPFFLLSVYCQDPGKACLHQEGSSGYSGRKCSPDPGHSLGDNQCTSLWPVL